MVPWNRPGDCVRCLAGSEYVLKAVYNIHHATQHIPLHTIRIDAQKYFQFNNQYQSKSLTNTYLSSHHSFYPTMFTPQPNHVFKVVRQYAPGEQWIIQSEHPTLVLATTCLMEWGKYVLDCHPGWTIQWHVNSSMQSNGEGMPCWTAKDGGGVVVKQGQVQMYWTMGR
jgi:hypothetical protein